MSEQQQFHVPEVPREIYAQNNKLQIADEIVSYIADRPIEYVPHQGILIYIKGATHPKKGFPTPEAIGALNIIKATLKEALHYPILILLVNKVKLLSSFNILFNKAFSPYKLQEIYLCKTSHTIYKFLDKVLQDLNIPQQLANETAYNLAHILEYDDAYRYRLQDIATEANYQHLRHQPRKEIKRLLELYVYRESGGVFPRIAKQELRVAQQIRRAVTALLVLLAIPKIKKAFINNSHLLQGVRYDESDKYWAYLKDGDYHYGGETYEERTKGWEIPVPYKIIM